MYCQHIVVVVHSRKCIEIWRKKREKVCSCLRCRNPFEICTAALCSAAFILFSCFRKRNLRQSDFVSFFFNSSNENFFEKAGIVKDIMTTLYQGVHYNTPYLHWYAMLCRASLLAKNKCRFWYANCHAIILTQKDKVFFWETPHFMPDGSHFPLMTLLLERKKESIKEDGLISSNVSLLQSCLFFLENKRKSKLVCCFGLGKRRTWSGRNDILFFFIIFSKKQQWLSKSMHGRLESSSINWAASWKKIVGVKWNIWTYYAKKKFSMVHLPTKKKFLDNFYVLSLSEHKCRGKVEAFV